MATVSAHRQRFNASCIACSEAYQASDSGVEAASGTNDAPRQEIPEDLLCSLCRDLLTDAVMIPCCGNSFCDECKSPSRLWVEGKGGGYICYGDEYFEYVA